MRTVSLSLIPSRLETVLMDGLSVCVYVIGPDRGNLGVVLFNHGEEDFKVEVGDRVAQLILERICIAEVEEVEELDDT